MPVFKSFIKKTVNKDNARPFKAAKNLKMMVIDARTGKKANYGSKKTIVEVFKSKTFENKYFNDNDDLKYKISEKNILKFY